MAKTRQGKKVVPVKPYRRSKPDGGGKGRKTVPVRRHKRSTPD